MYANIAATVMHWILATLLTIYFDMGIVGVSISSSLQFIVRFAVAVCYIQFSGKFDAPDIQVPLFGHPENFRNWKSQFFLSLQCMSLMVWSWWAMDVFTLIASNMGDSNLLSAQHILRNVTLLTFMIPVGIMISS
jgi:Na+-driven multidrug efflux pump